MDGCVTISNFLFPFISPGYPSLLALQKNKKKKKKRSTVSRVRYVGPAFCVIVENEKDGALQRRAHDWTRYTNSALRSTAGVMFFNVLVHPLAGFVMSIVRAMVGDSNAFQFCSLGIILFGYPPVPRC